MAIRSKPGAADPAHGTAGVTLALIRGLLPNLKGAQLKLARALLDDPEQFITQSISELARRCGVSTGSVVLFCKTLGVKGFASLKIALARQLAEPVLAGTGKGHAGRATVLEDVFREHVRALEETLRLNTARVLDTAIGALGAARRIVLFSIGLSYPIAYSLYGRLRLIGLPALIEYDSHLQLAAAAEMKRGEVALAVSASGSTSETVECLQLARSRGAKTICITNSVRSPLAGAADVCLHAAPAGVKYFQAALASRVAQLALCDVLVTGVALRRKRAAFARLENAEEHLLTRRLRTRR